jgi:hypothetical protein
MCEECVEILKNINFILEEDLDIYVIECKNGEQLPKTNCQLFCSFRTIFFVRKLYKLRLHGAGVHCTYNYENR